MTYSILKIYKDVMIDQRLKSLEEKILVNHILGFQNDGKCCFSSNSYISGLLDKQQDYVVDLIASLCKRKIIKWQSPVSSKTRMLSVIFNNQTLDCESGDTKYIIEF